MTREYYAPGIGLVKREFERDNVNQFYHLTNVIKSTMNENVEIILGWTEEYEETEDGERFYFPVAMYDNMEINFNTNADVPALFTEAFKIYLSEVLGIVLDPAVAINSIQNDRFESILYIDMTPAFAEEMMEMGEDAPLFTMYHDLWDELR
jgi:hypothetical protein